MEKKVIEIPEYRTKIPSAPFGKLSPSVIVDEQLKGIKLVEQDQKLLAEKLDGILKVDKLEGGLSVGSFSHVGVVNFENFVVEVRPKILIEPQNLFGMINYAFDLDHFKKITESGYLFKSKANFLIEIIVSLFVAECQTLVKQGLYKSYITYQENVSYLRGKLLLKQHMINVLENRPQFACEYDEIEYDNLENQILLFCLKRSYKITKFENLKRDIRKLIFQFSGVVSDRLVTLYDFKKITYNRLNNNYTNAHQLSELIITSSGMVDFYSEAKHHISSFFVDMNEIFEKFVYRLFEKYYHPREFKIFEQKKKKAWTIDFTKSKSIRTDILLENLKTKQNTIIDTKYKEKLTELDLYQIGFYIHEYRKSTENWQKTGYAILPKPKNEEMEKPFQIISSTKQGIHVVQSYINLDEIIPLLYKYDSESQKKLQTKIESLLPTIT